MLDLYPVLAICVAYDGCHVALVLILSTASRACLPNLSLVCIALFA